MSAPTPVLIPEAFANDAGPSFINVIPATTADPQAASYSQGFPAQTFQPVSSGGQPPLGQDFNGILNAVTQHLFALQGGQLQKYRTDVRDALAGYALGAILAMADGAGWWISTTAANVTDPDAGGAGWEPVYAYGATTKAVTGGALTLTAIEASRPYLIFTGTLSGNQQIVLPASFRHWLVINNCVMGAFTLTFKTAAQVGGVALAAAGGAASPTPIYCNGVDVNRVFVPSALPTSVTPVANTIVLRDNTGAAYGTTAADGDASSQLATTDFVNPGSSLTANGYTMHPDGSLVQWGSAGGAGANRTVNFPLMFATGTVPYSIQLTPRITSGDALGQMPTVVGNPTATQFVFAPSDGSNGTYWVAHGRWLP